MKKAYLLIILTLFSAFLFGFKSIVLADVTFGSNVRVDDTSSSNIYQGSPSVALDASGNIYLAWMDFRNGNPDIYFAKSADGGDTFGSNVRVAESTNWELSPSLVVDTFGDVYIAWDDWGIDNSDTNRTDIYFAKSTDGGTSFNSAVRVDDTGTSITEQRNVSLAADLSGNIYASWMDRRNGNLDIYLSKSTNGGDAFEPNVRVDDTGSSISTQGAPSIEIGATGNVYVTWPDDRNGDYDTYFAKSINGGSSFEPNVRVDDAGNTFSHVQDTTIAVDKNENIYVAWRDRRNGPGTDIYFAKSTDFGSSFDVNVQVDPTGSSLMWDQSNPSLGVNAVGNIYIAWDQNDIYFTESTDNGLSFGARVRVDDTGSSWSSLQYEPSLAMDNGGNAYVAWRDDRNGNSDIYFAKGVVPEPVTMALFGMGLLGAGIFKRKKK